MKEEKRGDRAREESRRDREERAVRVRWGGGRKGKSRAYLDRERGNTIIKIDIKKDSLIDSRARGRGEREKSTVR
jgi:hypothetical protein